MERQIGFRKIADPPKLKGIYFSCGRNWVTLRNSTCRKSVKGASALSWELKYWKGKAEMNLALVNLCLMWLWKRQIPEQEVSGKCSL